MTHQQPPTSKSLTVERDSYGRRPCGDCLAVATASVGRSPVTDGPILIAVVLHDVGCPAMQRHGNVVMTPTPDRMLIHAWRLEVDEEPATS